MITTARLSTELIAMNYRNLVRNACLSSLVMFGAASCATDDNPPCRRVSAEQFMRNHTFKGMPSDQFIGVTYKDFHNEKPSEPQRAFKQIWQMGFFHGWAVIWCPTSELPEAYLRKVSNNL